MPILTKLDANPEPILCKSKATPGFIFSDRPTQSKSGANPMSILSHLDANPGPILTNPTSTQFQSEAIFKPTPILANPVLFQTMPIQANPSQSMSIQCLSKIILPFQQKFPIMPIRANLVQSKPILINPCQSTVIFCHSKCFYNCNCQVPIIAIANGNIIGIDNRPIFCQSGANPPIRCQSANPVPISGHF